MDHKFIYIAKRNPAVSVEDWPRAWRAHAVFASQFPALGAVISSLFYCNRLRTFEPPGVDRDHDGVAIVSSPVADSFPFRMTPENRAKIFADELRVFHTNSPAFSFCAKETVVHGDAPGPAAVFRFLARAAGTTREQFRAHWGSRHADLGKRAVGAGVARYVQNELTHDPPPAYPVDGIAEAWFAGADDAARALGDGVLAPLTRDLPAFCDMDRTITIVTTVVHRWPKAG